MAIPGIQVQRSHGAPSMAPAAATHPGGSTEQPADVPWIPQGYWNATLILC